MDTEKLATANNADVRRIDRGSLAGVDSSKPRQGTSARRPGGSKNRPRWLCRGAQR